MVFEEMKSRIFSGRYEQGSILPTQDELAKEFGVSRTVMRDAFHKLSSLGLVESQQGRGSFVRFEGAVSVMSSVLESFNMNAETIQDLMEARYHLEKLIVGLAAERVTAADIEFLRRNVERMDAAVVAGDIPAFAAIDLEFHEKLGEISHNVVLTRILTMIRGMMKNFFSGFSKTPGVAPRAVEYHKEIFAAIVSHDAAAAERKMQEHLGDIIENLKKKYDIKICI
jgi:GntR family transcriptional repressor for pyruvate dehydrogenase complex